MMDTLPDGWALVDPVDIEADTPLAQVCATPGIQRVGVALQGADGWNDTVVLTRTDVPDDMGDTNTRAQTMTSLFGGWRPARSPALSWRAANCCGEEQTCPSR